MSAIAGIYNVNGRPVDEELLHMMVDIVEYRGPDGSGTWTNGCVGLAHRLLWTTEESFGERQPMTNGRGFWITADCRIDNREELEREFRSLGIWYDLQKRNGSFPEILPDVAYILLAYALWEEEAPNHLLGDFAFAIWNEERHELFCARDHIGLKPFVYFWNGNRFLFGSEMKQIFQDPVVPEDLNIPHLADILVMSFPNREETPFQAIRRLPPAHWLRIRDGRLEIKRYWDWDPDTEPTSSASLEKNAEVFLHLLKEAVKARLRSPAGYRVGSLLSGGLDSSSIAALAATLLSLSRPFVPLGERREIRGFPVFTLRFPEANPAYRLKNVDFVDESVYQEALIERYGLESHPVEIQGCGPFENLEEHLWHQETPLFFPNLAYFQHLFRIVAASGVRALLHGEGGDELFYVGSQCFLEDLKRHRLRAFLSDWLERREKWGASFPELVSSITRTFLPEWMKSSYRRWIRTPVPSWMNRDFAKKIHLRKRAEKDFRWNPQAHASSSYGIRNWLEAGHIPLYVESLERTAAASAMDLRLPFLDLRLLRFSAALPWNQKVSRGWKKALLRETMKGLLPEPVRMRSGKTEFSPVVRTALERYSAEELTGMFENPHSILRSMIVPKKVKRFYQSFFTSNQIDHLYKGISPLRYLWYLASLDQWLKHGGRFFRKPEESPNERKERRVASVPDREW